MRIPAQPKLGRALAEPDVVHLGSGPAQQQRAPVAALDDAKQVASIFVGHVDVQLDAGLEFRSEDLLAANLLASGCLQDPILQPGAVDWDADNVDVSANQTPAADAAGDFDPGTERLQFADDLLRVGCGPGKGKVHGSSPCAWS